jgi:predicted ATPase/class 3 adenylate cyclase
MSDLFGVAGVPRMHGDDVEGVGTGRETVDVTAAPSGTVTFLFTDIEGSTRLWEHYPDVMRVAVAAQEQLLRAVTAEHGGLLVKSMGDGVMAAFGSAHEAASAAAAAQTQLQAETWPSVGSVRVRMGLHTGEAEERDGDYFGPTLNRTARLMGIGHGGQVLLSEATAALVRDGIGLRPLGEHRLRDLSRPEHVYQLVDDRLPDDFPPLRSIDEVPNNLPVQLTTFVGRHDELLTITKLLSEHRLVTLVGSAGCGKTRLALQVAADQVHAYTDGAWLVDLSPLHEGDLLAQALIAALRLNEPATGRPLTEVVVDQLAHREMLVVLDNCEHLLEQAARMAGTLLAGCPGVRVLATSRETLGVTGGVTWRVPSLDLPLAGEPVEAAAAGQLFVDRARLRRPTLSMDAAGAAAVADICRRLDGIPLAIELAAARVNALSCEEIARRLEDRLALLTAGSRAAPERQQTMRTAIDWSYRLLGEDEARLLAQLSVFAGGCTLGAAEAVCGVDEQGNESVLDPLVALVDKSLVNADDDGRYRMLESIRQYARERLTELGESERVQERHAEFHLRLARRLARGLWGPEVASALRDLGVEQDNFRQVLGWAMSTARNELAHRMAEAMSGYWYRRGAHSEGRAWLDAVLAMPAPEDEQLRAWCMQARANIDAMARPNPRSVAFAGDAIEIFRRHGNSYGLAMSLYDAAMLALGGGDVESARQLAEESTQVARDAQLPRVVALGAWALSYVCIAAGDQATAMASTRVSEDSARESGNIALEAGIRALRARVLLAHGGDRAEALRLAEDALAQYRTTGTTISYVFVVAQVAWAKMSLGDHAGARDLLVEAVSDEAEIDEYFGWAQAELLLVLLHVAEANVPSARSRAQALVRLVLDGNVRLFWPFALDALATVALASGEPEGAVRLLAMTEAECERMGMSLEAVGSEHASLVASARRALGAEFDDAWRRGSEAEPRAVLETALPTGQTPATA